ncbi:MAG TPA: ABC transporter permease [Gemmatimonadales bacterium]|nr:ABC transporter permease [Gemmatimonadales bacterium]
MSPATARGMAREALGRIAALVLAAILAAVVILPVVALVLRVTPARFVAQLGDSGVRESLWLSVKTSVAATLLCLVLGLPMAYLLATRRFPGKRAVEVLMDLPMVIPPTVAGFALLMAFGRAGLLGRTLSTFGITLPFSTAGVVVAQVFMAVPFLVGAARAGFEAVDRRYLDAAATLRAGEFTTFWRVRIPLAMPGIVAGVGMAWARALGEFGATITFAGNLAGTTRTVPLDVYLRLQENLDAAATLSLLLVVMAAVLLTAMRQAGLGLFAPQRASSLAPLPAR